MSRFTMSTYIKTLKKAAANTNISDEEFVRLLFAPLIESGNVKDKNGSQLDLDKNRVSRLMRGKKHRYPIGSIVNIETDNAIYYLLVISDFDINNNARSEKEKIETALKKMLDFYDCKGQGYELYLPLVGTGRSRAGLPYRNHMI